MFLHDKNIRSVLLICLILLSSVVMFSFFSEDDTEGASGNDLEEIIMCLEGVDEVKVAYFYSESMVPEGIAISYKGECYKETDIKIYEMVRALYDIPYTRIYVSH